MTCWSAPPEGEALGLDVGEVVGEVVGEATGTLGEADGDTGTSAATRSSGTMMVVWLLPVTFMSACALPGPAWSVIWKGPGSPPTVS